MSCPNWARTSLNFFIRSFIDLNSIQISRRPAFTPHQSFRPISTSRRIYGTDRIANWTSPAPRTPRESMQVDIEDDRYDDVVQAQRERPAWQAHKKAMKEKLGGEAWNPRKKLSPDTMDGIRHLHSTQPERFTTPVLAEHFKVSPEAIRRILKSKWRPSDEEHEARMRRWDKRGERIWSNLVEMGVKPPKMWRDMGVGRATDGEKPKWKGRRRTLTHVRDSASNNFVVEDGDIIPIVNSSGRTTPAARIPLSERL